MLIESSERIVNAFKAWWAIYEIANFRISITNCACHWEITLFRSDNGGRLCIFDTLICADEPNSLETLHKALFEALKQIAEDHNYDSEDFITSGGATPDGGCEWTIALKPR